MSVTHLHLILNHVPVLAVVFSAGLLGFAVLRRDSHAARIALAGCVLAALVAIPVYLTGESAEHALERSRPVSEALLEPHEEMAGVSLIGIEALGLFAAVVLWTRRHGEAMSGPLLWTVFALAVIVGASLARTAYLGGQVGHPELQQSGPVAPAGVAQRE